MLTSNDYRFSSTACVHYTHTVRDTVNPGYVDVLPSGFTWPNVPLVADSVFRVIAEDSVVDGMWHRDIEPATGSGQLGNPGTSG